MSLKLKRLQHNKPKMDKNESSDEDKRSKPSSSTSTKNSKVTSTSSKPKFGGGSFLSLDATLNDPSAQVFKNDRFVCIRDKYPKSRFHLLLVPLTTVSKGAKLLKVQDLIKLDDSRQVLREMKQLSEEIVSKHCPDALKTRIRCGFHAIQSMNPLHMHIISNDFISDCLKNKKHWNSFTSPYFVHLNQLIDNLDQVKDYFAEDKFNLNKPNVLKAYLDSNLKCHVCNKEINNIPNLKKHLVTH